MLVNLKSWVIFLVWYSLNGYARSCGWLDRCVNLEEIAFSFFFLIGTWTEFENGKTNGRLYWAWTGSVENFAQFRFNFFLFFWAVVIEIFRNTVKIEETSHTRRVGFFLLFLDGKRSSTNMQLFLWITCGYWYMWEPAPRLQKKVAALSS